MIRRSDRTFFLLLLYRLSSIVFVQTSYAPDEYWQSLEVAHDMTFGYGYLTWEWKHGLRSYFHPFIFYVLYKGLHTFSLDFPLVIIIIPKVFQALLTAASDWYFFLLCKNFRLQNYWIKVAVFTNWFWYYCGSRTLINTFETCLTIVALYYYPWNILMKKLKKNKNDINCVTVQKNSLKYLILASINCLVRPTAAIIWGPLVLLQLFFSNSKDVTKFIFKCILPALVLTLPIFIIIDYIWYGKFCIPAYNFIVFNTFKGISSFYGTNSFHWYFTQGLPVVLGLKSFPFVLGLLSFLKELTRNKNQFEPIFLTIIVLVTLNITILSTIPHKEFRFLLPLIPLMMLIAVKFESEFFSNKQKWKLIWTAVMISGFVVPSVLFGILHQRGALSLMEYLRSEIKICYPNCFFLFLMPCHSTPLYSHLHSNVSTRFLECDPPLTKHHYDESEDFFNDPNKWLNHHWASNNYPTHISFFDTIESSVVSFLNSKGFTKKYEILHTIFLKENFGRYILVYKKH